MKQPILYIFLLFLTLTSQAQPTIYQFTRFDSIPVTVNSNALNFPWAGGLNYSQFSNIDLNFDGAQDLFIFDRTGNKTITFVHSGNAGTSEFIYAPEYENSFPAMTNWALLADYNCDGLPDIFTNFPGGIRIYKNTSSVSTGISFQLVENLLYSYYYSGMVNLYVSSVDLPAIHDIDYDGDLDILTFSLVGSKLEYHKNLSVESGYGCDSLIYQLKNDCWGNFNESILSNQLTLFDTCSTSLPNTEMGGHIDSLNLRGDASDYSYQFSDGARHSGSCLMAFDNNGINSKDLLIGDISGKNIVMAENGGTAPNLASSMVLQDTLFPSYDVPVNIEIMACPFSVDINFDNIKDLICTPQSTAVSENAVSVSYYKNDGLNDAPDYTFQSPDFLQYEMIERGEGALPVLFDYDGDGLLDLVISNYGFFNNATDTYTSKLGLFRNNGTGSNPSFIQINDNFENLSATMSENSLHPAFGDLNNDGDEDMIVGNYSGTLFYFENIAGAGNPADFTLSQANLTDNNAAIIDIGQYSTPHLVDLDRDGDKDLIIGERNGNLNYYENIGSASAHNFRFRSDTLGGISVNQAGYVTGYSVPVTYDDNGKYQLIIGSQTGYVHHYDSIESNIFGYYRQVDTTLLGTPHGIRSGVAVADINGDTYMDIFTGNYRGGLSFFKGDPNGNVSIAENVFPEITLYPNPSSGILYFESSIGGQFKLDIYDITGRLIQKNSVANNGMIDLRTFEKGVYLVNIKYGSQWITKKIVRQ
jgi:hypothetical protein